MMLELIKSELAGRLNEAVEQLEDVLATYPQTDIPATEIIKDGFYIREITIPADTILTGRVWLDDYVDIMISGDIIVATADGVKQLSGYNICDGKGGRKRAGYTLTDTKWVTVHKTNAKTCEGLLDKLSVYSMAEYKVAQARLDYNNNFGHCLDLIEEQSNNISDMIPMPAEFEPLLEIKESSIEGLGLFSKAYFKPGDHIAPARIKGFRTLAGRYSNHSCFSNAKMLFVNATDVALVATADIKPGDELLTDYIDTLTAMQEVPCQE